VAKAEWPGDAKVADSAGCAARRRSESSSCGRIKKMAARENILGGRFEPPLSPKSLTEVAPVVSATAPWSDCSDLTPSGGAQYKPKINPNGPEP
jgi:hypothetical protein